MTTPTTRGVGDLNMRCTRYIHVQHGCHPAAAELFRIAHAPVRESSFARTSALWRPGA